MWSVTRELVAARSGEELLRELTAGSTRRNPSHHGSPTENTITTIIRQHSSRWWAERSCLCGSRINTCRGKGIMLKLSSVAAAFRSIGYNYRWTRKQGASEFPVELGSVFPSVPIRPPSPWFRIKHQLSRVCWWRAFWKPEGQAE